MVETLGLLIVEVAVAEVEGAAGFRDGDFFDAAFGDNLDVLGFFMVDDFVEAAVLADASEFFEGGSVFERRVLRVRLGSGLAVSSATTASIRSVPVVRAVASCVSNASTKAIS